MKIEIKLQAYHLTREQAIKVLKSVITAIETGDSVFGGTNMAGVNVLPQTLPQDSGVSCGLIEKTRIGSDPLTLAPTKLTIQIGSWEFFPE